MKKQKTPSIVILAITTTITVIVWIGFGVYQILTSKPEVDIPKAVLEPLNPELDTNTLAEIAERVYFEEGETTGFSSISVVDIEESEATSSGEFEETLVIEEIEATESAEPVATEEAQLQ